MSNTPLSEQSIPSGHLILVGEEQKAAWDFMFSHPCTQKHLPKKMQLTVTATGIGLHLNVSCPYCACSEDITSYDSW